VVNAIHAEAVAQERAPTFAVRRVNRENSQPLIGEVAQKPLYKLIGEGAFSGAACARNAYDQGFFLNGKFL
jgi:hypothetical protein